MLVCCSIFYSRTGFRELSYKMYDKETKSFGVLSEYEVMSILKRKDSVSNLKLDDNGRITGNGIDIKKLNDYDGVIKFTVISELTDNGDVIGYEAVTNDLRVVQLNKHDAISATKFGRVTNMAYVEDKNFIRLITRNGVGTKVKQLDYSNMDTCWDTSIRTAKNIFKACGFEGGYSERYDNSSVFNIMYDKNGNILYFDESLNNKDRKLCYHGGHLVTETLGERSSFLGNSATTESLYTGLKYTYNTFDIRERFVANYKEVIKNQQPVPYMLDDNGNTVYHLGLATREMIEKREKLAKDLEKDDDLFGLGLEYLVFIRSKYYRFNDRLKQILKLYYDNNTDMIVRLAISDVLGFNESKVDETKLNNMVILLHVFCGDYGVNEDWTRLLQSGINKEKARREEIKRIKEEERKANLQNKGTMTGLFSMFSKK